ncbi:MAG TPA: hypothetical protein VHA56_14465 [Mucilaginibacter sp.]|nr:hypothetical protein [Mucilaginibacter sp.]
MKKQLRTILNQEKTLNHLKMAKGKVAEAGITAGISRSQIYKWIKTDNDFRAEVKTVYSNLNLYAKSKLLKIEIDNDRDALLRLKKFMDKKISRI